MKGKYLLLLSVLAILCLPALVSAQPKRIIIDGSSTVFPVTEAVAEEFQKLHKGQLRVTVGISGTGGGFRKFCRGESDIQNASRPISRTEMEACRAQGIEYVELPVAYDGIAIVVNPRNDWVRSLTIEDLKKMWEPAAVGRVNTWRDVRPEWPNSPLKLFGPGADSGTFDYFTEAVVGKSKASRGDFTATEDDNVIVQGVSGDRFALGYFGLAYYEENRGRLRVVPIEGRRGPVTPSEKTVMDGTYTPLSRPLFIYVNRKSLAKPEVHDFVNFFLTAGPKLIRQAKFIPLPPEAYRLAQDRLARQITGSIFTEGEWVGVTVEELLRREAGKK
jgi:phosphate transport system substrate-binding protein